MVLNCLAVARWIQCFSVVALQRGGLILIDGAPFLLLVLLIPLDTPSQREGSSPSSECFLHLTTPVRSHFRLLETSIQDWTNRGEKRPLCASGGGESEGDREAVSPASLQLLGLCVIDMPRRDADAGALETRHPPLRRAFTDPNPTSSNYNTSASTGSTSLSTTNGSASLPSSSTIATIGSKSIPSRKMKYSPPPSVEHPSNDRRGRRRRHDEDDSHFEQIITGTDSRSSRARRVPLLLVAMFAGVFVIHTVMTGVESLQEKTMKSSEVGKKRTRVQQRGFSFAQDAATDDAVDNRRKYDSRKAIDSAEEIINKAPSGEDVLSATVLSRASQLASLVSQLDASDVVECYVVTRMARLHAGGRSGSNNDMRMLLDETDDENQTGPKKSNDSKQPGDEDAVPSAPSIPSGPVLVRKSALAFRYRPRVATVLHPHVPDSPLDAEDAQSSEAQLDKQKYFELTLEYGPQRTGVSRTSESIPMVHIDTELAAETNNEGMGKYVSWENVGRVYHSTRISNEWTEAYYMAPITGVVLEKIIQREWLISFLSC